MHNTMISVKDKVSSFLQLLQHVSLTHQLSLLQREVEILAGQEARLVEIAEKALRLASSRQESDVITTAGNNFSGNHKYTVV